MKKWNSLAVAGIAVLLALGYGIPPVVMAIEDNGRKLEVKSFEVEEIQLDFQNTDIIEEMGIFPEMLFNNIVVESYDKYIDVWTDKDAVQGTDEGDVQENVDSETENSAQMIETSIREFLDILNPEHDITFMDFKANYYVMMVSNEDERVYPVWDCIGVDEEKRNYRFWLDDTSGTVLAFGIPYEVMDASGKGLNMVMERLGNYYGFDIWGLAEPFSSSYKEPYWQNVLVLYDEAGNESSNLYLFKVEERFLFNIYPESMYLHDVSYSISE